MSISFVQSTSSTSGASQDPSGSRAFFPALAVGNTLILILGVTNTGTSNNVSTILANGNVGTKRIDINLNLGGGVFQNLLVYTIPIVNPLTDVIFVFNNGNHFWNAIIAEYTNTIIANRPLFFDVISPGASATGVGTIGTGTTPTFYKNEVWIGCFLSAQTSGYSLINPGNSFTLRQQADSLAASASNDHKKLAITDRFQLSTGSLTTSLDRSSGTGGMIGAAIALAESGIVTHTTDTLLKKENTLTHNTDSFLKAQISINHTTDTLLTQVESVRKITSLVVDSPSAENVGDVIVSVLGIAGNSDALTEYNYLQPVQEVKIGSGPKAELFVDDKIVKKAFVERTIEEPL